MDAFNALYILCTLGYYIIIVIYYYKLFYFYLVNLYY